MSHAILPATCLTRLGLMCGLPRPLTNQLLSRKNPYLTEYGVEKLVRDLRVHQILEGTNQIMPFVLER